MTDGRYGRVLDRTRERIASHEARIQALERENERLWDFLRALELELGDSRASSVDVDLSAASAMAELVGRVGRLEGAADRSATRGAAGGIASGAALVLLTMLARAMGVPIPD